MDKRVAVAKDVIKHLQLVTVTPGTYCTNENYKTKKSGNVQPLIDNASKNCRVCALGGMFLSLVRLYNKVDFKYCYVNDIQGTYFHVYSIFIKSKLKEEAGFTALQIRDIESAFEGYEHQYYESKYANPTERLEAIMRNIIANKGEFSPNGQVFQKSRKVKV